MLCVALLFLMVGVLAYSSISGGYSYKDLTRTISVRTGELPLAGDLSRSLGDMRVTLSRARRISDAPLDSPEFLADGPILRNEFNTEILKVTDILKRYRARLKTDLDTDPRLSDRTMELQILEQLDGQLARIVEQKDSEDWVLEASQSHIESLALQVDEMYDLSGQLPKHLHTRMHAFSGEVRGEYRTWIILSSITFVLAFALLLALIVLSYIWVVAPLRVLIDGSRRIALQDDFDYRIFLRSKDEFAELARALNDMTARFQVIRNNLDQQVQERTREVVRSEQLASVGFLAAGVAHEINNPLASIAWAAEALESRIDEAQQAVDNGEPPPPEQQAADQAVLRKYLRRIQDEAFRCKGITDSLLDFSRLGDMKKHDTDLGELLEGVIDMVRHLGKYREKKVVFARKEVLVAPVNAQEMKQVALNLITNALDSLDEGGTVWVDLRRSGATVELIVRDNGCGMSAEVQQHLFEPFFTRRRDGSGTGLGLSITYRIVNDHGGRIEAFSEGPGKGSQMRVVLPLAAKEKATHERDSQKRLQAA